MDPILQFLFQGGGFALACYLVWWITQKLDKKLDTVIEKLDQLIKVISNELIHALREREKEERVVIES